MNVSSLFYPSNLLLGLLIDFDEIAAEAEHLVEDCLAQVGYRAHCLLFTCFTCSWLKFLFLDDCLRVKEPIEICHEKD